MELKTLEGGEEETENFGIQRTNENLAFKGRFQPPK